MATGLSVQMRMLKWQTSMMYIKSVTYVYIKHSRTDLLCQISIFCKHRKTVMLLDQEVSVS